MATGPGAILARVAGEVRRTGFREIRDILHASSPAHVHLRSRLTFVLGATLLVDAVASALILLFERHAHGTEITNIGDSVFWTTTQLLTVSSQLPNPISAPARVAGRLPPGLRDLRRRSAGRLMGSLLPPPQHGARPHGRERSPSELICRYELLERNVGV
jgi:hypothetical protein